MTSKFSFEGSEAQWEEVVYLLTPHSVVEFGAGDLTHAEHLALRGCERVLAIDKEPCPVTTAPINLQYKRGYYEDVTILDIVGYTAAFMSWPNVYNVRNLPELVSYFDLVVYMGYNFEGSICGDDALWEQFRHREVLRYLPLRNSIMIAYGSIGERREDDDLYPEELAATSREMMFPYSDSDETLNQVFGK